MKASLCGYAPSRLKILTQAQMRFRTLYHLPGLSTRVHNETCHLLYNQLTSAGVTQKNRLQGSFEHPTNVKTD